MHQQAIDELTTGIVEEAAGLFGIEHGSTERLGSFESFVFKGMRDGKPVALRLAHSTHRDVGQVISEFDWMAYLSKAGAAVTTPLPSVNGRLAERLDTPGGYFIASAQSWADGACPNPADPGQWNGTLFMEWGAVTGRLHRLTRDYGPSPGVERRPIEAGLVGWDESTLGDKAREILRLHKAVSGELHDLPRTRDTFGLCHTDIHQWNFHVHEGRMIVFDFDDSAYDNMVGDIGIAVYYSTVFGSGADVADPKALGSFAEGFLRDFMAGYESEHRLPDALLEKLPSFVSKRQTLLYLILQPLKGISEQRRLFLDATERATLSGTPFIDMDYNPRRYR